MEIYIYIYIYIQIHLHHHPSNVISTEILHGFGFICPVKDPANRLTPCSASGNSGGCTKYSNWLLL